MAKLEQALILDPPTELRFQAPFSDTTTSYLKLTNPTDRLIFFKLKTTAPKTYCVRPNSGIIKPNETKSIAVMLQPVNFDAGDKNKHKFMVQSVFSPIDKVKSSRTFDDIWQDTPPENFMNSKLKCVFVDKSASEISKDGSTEKDTKPEKVITSDVPAEVHASPQKEGHGDISKLLNENRQLANLLAELRQENSQLKEESLRSRVIRGGATSENQTQSAKLSHRPHRPGQEGTIPGMFDTKNIAIMFIVLLIGIYLGITIF